MHNFVICIGHLDIFCSLSYANLPKVDIAHIQYPVIAFVNITIFLIKSPFKYREAVKLIVANNVSQIRIFSWKLKVFHWQQTLSVVFPEVTCSFCSFLRKQLPKAQVRKTIVCLSVILLSRNGAVGKEQMNSAHNSMHKHFSSRQSLHLHLPQKGSMYTLKGSMYTEH